MTKQRSARTLATSAATAAAAVVLAASSADVGVEAFAPQHLQQPPRSCAARTAPADVVRRSSGPPPWESRRRGGSERWTAVPGAGGGGALGSSSVEEAVTNGPETEAESETSPSASATGPLREEFDNNVEQARASTRGLGAVVREKIGTVDESRLVFPEFASGEVPRLYSNLDYSKSEEGKVSVASHAAGSTFGAAALIAGTAIGAGVLALPAATAPAGFLPSSAGLLLAWGYMVVSGLLISELTLNRIGETGRPGVGLIDVYRSGLGPPWAAAGAGAYFFLHYAVMVAYFARGGANLESFLQASGLGSVAGVPGLGPAALAAGIGGLIFLAKPSTVEKVNNALVVGVGATFLGIMGMGAGSADFGALVAAENQHPEFLVDAFPILFLSLVYHNVVPTVVTQLEGDKDKITKAIIGGTAAPLLMLLAWNAVILGNVAGMPEALAGDFDPIALLQGGEHGGRALSALVGGFSELAITTSLIGFIYANINALTDVFGLPTDGPRHEQWKPALFAATLLPPVALAIGNPDVFFKALDYGGAFGVSTLFLVLPPIMVWKQRYGDEQTPLTVKPMVPLGKIPLGSLWKAAATLIVEQGADKLGVIDYVKDTLDFL